jgi:hypothetical protein
MIHETRTTVWDMLKPKPFLSTEEGTELLRTVNDLPRDAVPTSAREAAVQYLLQHKVNPHLTVVCSAESTTADLESE